MSQPTQYAPPAGPPPAPSYGPPPGSPPEFPPPPVIQPPITCPMPLASHRAAVNQTDTPDEPLPPYTAKSTDPLPTWAQSGSPRFIDLTTSTTSLTSSPHLPLDPPPECFSTPSPPRIRSRSFAPFRVPSRERSLAGGFAVLWAPDELAHHGLTQADWTRFLLDLGTTARMAAQGLSVRGGAQSASGGRLLKLAAGNRGMAYDAAFVKTPVEEVQSLVNVWNESALERRKVRVTLHPKVDASGRQKEGYDLLVEAL